MIYGKFFFQSNIHRYLLIKIYVVVTYHKKWRKCKLKSLHNIKIMQKDFSNAIFG